MTDYYNLTNLKNKLSIIHKTFVFEYLQILFRIRLISLFLIYYFGIQR